MLKLRHEADDRPDHFQVYSGQVRVGTIYKTSGNPSGNSWFWGLNGVQNGPGPFKEGGGVPCPLLALARLSRVPWRA